MLIAAFAVLFLLVFAVAMIELPLLLLRLETWSLRHHVQRFDPEDFLS